MSKHTYLKRDYLNGRYEREAADEPTRAWVGSKGQYLVTRYADGATVISTGNLDAPALAIVRPDGSAYSPASNNRELTDNELARMQKLLDQFAAKVA